MSVDVVIPTWNKSELLGECLDRLLKDPLLGTAIVVDNASTDDTAALLKREYPQVKLVEMECNVGFGNAVNAGVAVSAGEFFVTINNDAYVEKGFLESITAPFSEESVGMVAGVLITDGQEQRIDAAGIEFDRFLSGYSYLRHGRLELLDTASDSPLGPCGGAAAYRRSVFDHVGGFDCEIFAYYEDLDLSLQIREQGYTCVLARNARAMHVGSATLGKQGKQLHLVAGDSRGYIAGRYRVAKIWLLGELIFMLPACLRMRSLAPVSSRVSGYRRGRGLPARSSGGSAARALGLRESIKRQLGMRRSS